MYLRVHISFDTHQIMYCQIYKSTVIRFLQYKFLGYVNTGLKILSVQAYPVQSYRCKIC